MKKICFLILIGFFSYAGWAAAKPPASLESHPGKYEKSMDLIQDIEALTADCQNFVDAVKSRRMVFQEVSPSAVANYMEAFANEGMLGAIPREYLNSAEIRTSFYVVFEDISNIRANRKFYEHHFQTILKEDLLNDIESLTADYQNFVDAVKSRRIVFQEVSPPAVADYMEAFANEGMLGQIPRGYFDSPEIKTSMYVVFENPENIAHNWDMFEDRLLLDRLCSSMDR